jgi:hypothetical protein
VSKDEPQRDTLSRDEYARLLGIEDLARLLVSGWDHGYPLNDETRSEGELIDRLRDALAIEEPA